MPVEPTCNLEPGDVVPIPTFCEESIVIAVAAFVTKDISFVACEYFNCPTSVSAESPKYNAVLLPVPDINEIPTLLPATSSITKLL